LDTNGDGLNSRDELIAGGLIPTAFRAYGNTNPAAPNANYALINPGITKLSRDQVLIAAGDDVNAKSFGAFMDVIKLQRWRDGHEQDLRRLFGPL